MDQELTGREDDLTGAEERLAGSIEAVRRDLFRVMRVQQALFAYLDTLAKTFLTGIATAFARIPHPLLSRQAINYL